VQTNLSITGQPAQFGRGLLEDVGGKIIGQFADNLARSLGPEEPSTSASSAAPSPSESPVASAGSAASTEALPAAEAPAAAEAPRAAGPGAVAGAPASATRPAVPAGRSSFTSSAQLARPAADEIDLLDAAGGPVAKRLVPVLGGLVVLWLIIRWLRRR
jgi:hypothetical protein